MATVAETTSTPDHAMDLLKSLAAGETHVSDLAAKLKDKGVESVADVLTLLKGTMSTRRGAGEDASTIFSPADRAAPDPDATAKIVQRVPTVPVLIDGTLYDPKDIVRFNGRELHFVPAIGGAYMLATEDRGLVSDWQRFNRVSAAADAPASSPLASVPVHGVPIVSALYGPGHSTAWGPGTDTDHYTTFFEDVNLQGDGLWCKPNRGYTDLTHHATGIFGLGTDWNDRISSVFFHLTQFAQLFEHIQYAGQSLTLRGTERNLVPYGWNDRASSVGTW